MARLISTCRSDGRSTDGQWSNNQTMARTGEALLVVKRHIRFMRRHTANALWWMPEYP